MPETPRLLLPVRIARREAFLFYSYAQISGGALLTALVSGAHAGLAAHVGWLLLPGAAAAEAAALMPARLQPPPAVPPCPAGTARARRLPLQATRPRRWRGAARARRGGA